MTNSLTIEWRNLQMVDYWEMKRQGIKMTRAYHPDAQAWIWVDERDAKPCGCKYGCVKCDQSGNQIIPAMLDKYSK